jgi:hypothetical protein
VVLRVARIEPALAILFAEDVFVLVFLQRVQRDMEVIVLVNLVDILLFEALAEGYGLLADAADVVRANGGRVTVQLDRVRAQFEGSEVVSAFVAAVVSATAMAGMAGERGVGQQAG